MVLVLFFFLQIILTVTWVALRNRNNPAVFDHRCEHNQVKEGISVWHSRQRQILEHSDDSTEMERVGESLKHICVQFKIIEILMVGMGFYVLANVCACVCVFFLTEVSFSSIKCPCEL
jgi:hypothetical protein